MTGRLLISFVGSVLLMCLWSGPATAAQQYAFRAPGNLAYCGYILNGWRCISPKTGDWVQFTLIYGERVRVSYGRDARLVGYRNTRVDLLRPGASWASSDAEVIRCWATRTSLSCAHSSGLRLTATPTGIRTFVDTPDRTPEVQALFRTHWGAYCGIDTDNLEPANPVLDCWNANNGTSVGVAHDNAGQPGSFGRSEKARGYRPPGFLLLQPGMPFAWRCRDVSGGFADRCSTATGKPVFRCSATASTLRCANTRGRGFTLAQDGSFTAF